MLALAGAVTAITQEPVSIPEEIEWTWEVRPPHPDAKFPKVLLLGDSISRNYFLQVTKDLEGVANVYLMASSTSVGDPRLPQQISGLPGSKIYILALVSRATKAGPCHLDNGNVPYKLSRLLNINQHVVLSRNVRRTDFEPIEDWHSHRRRDERHHH